ncbi:hypothetical protein [Actinophytocola sp.]|uniref:hypothetical protein n=1 Tax=Actinophytocola sp. TaxID=1872138 RepID=UPI002ED4AD63
MLQHRPRRPTLSWVRHPAFEWLSVGFLYLVATAANVVLALRMSEAWPVVLATAMALVTVLCAIAAWRRF